MSHISTAASTHSPRFNTITKFTIQRISVMRPYYPGEHVQHQQEYCYLKAPFLSARPSFEISPRQE